MNKKNALIGIAIIGVLALSFWYFAKEGQISSYEECIEAGNPMMKSYPPQCATKDGQIFVAELDDVLYENTELGIRFEYPSSYLLQERVLSAGRVSITLLDKSFVPVEGGEGPPTINLNLHPNTEGQTALSWMKSDTDSNFQLSSGRYEEGEVAGQSALFYQSDGLYPADNIVLVHKGSIVHLSGSYLMQDDQIREDFDDVIGNLELY